MATQGSLLLTLFVLLVTCFQADCHSHAGDCTMDMDECVFHLEVEHRLTMMDQRTLTFPSNGKLFAYDVVNTSDASPIPADNVITGDGWETPKLITAVNGKFPGPDIIVYEGQKIVVFVKNRLSSQAVTIHWHGLHQEGTPWMDGVPYVTQCPIHPGQTFKYEFYAKPKGTFWWHSHMGTQRTMGVFGAFIIKERLESDVEDKIMQIQDWNHDHDSDTGHMKMLFGAYQGRQKWTGYKSLDDTFFSIFEIQSGLINGRGRFYEENNVDHNGAPLTVYDVQPGKVYRFRVIATGALYPFRVSVDNHNLTVIASDGYDLEPVETESFIINPGERFDFKITADQPVGNYWIRGISIVQGRYHRADAILRYNGAGDEDPRTSRKVCSQTSRCTVVNCPFTQYPEMYTDCMTFDQLRSAVSDDPAPPYISGKFQEYFLNFAFPGIKTFPGSVNGRAFATPDVNPLVQPQEWSSPCTEPKCGPDNHCRCTHALSIGNGDTVQMIFMNMGVGRGWAHPIHMHGHSFYVLKIGNAQYNDTTGAFVEQNSDVDCRGKLYTRPDKSFCNDATWSNPDWLNGGVPGLNLDRAPRKDTIIVPSGGYVVIRIKADNPGLWNMHCHIELHNIDGMQMVLNESFSEVPSAPKGFPECHSYPPSTARLVRENDALHSGMEGENDGIFSDRNYTILFYLMVAVLAMQLFVFLAICCVCRRQSSHKSDSFSTGQTNRAFSGK